MMHCRICGWPFESDATALVPQTFINAGEVGFIVPGCFEVGGVESWHESLIPNLRSVSGLVAIHPGSAVGLRSSRFGCSVNSGVQAAFELYNTSKVIVAWNCAESLPQIARKKGSTKLVIISHADGTNSWTNKNVAESMTYADKLVAVCASAASVQGAGCSPILIPNAPDPKRIVRHNVIEKPSRKLAVVITRLSREKRLHLLAEAFGRHLSDWELWIVGGNNGLNCPAIPAYENVRLFPPTHTPGDYYAIADACVSASEEEGYGLSSAEGLLAGLPLISTQVGFLEAKPHLATIVPQDASAEDWAAAVQSATRKPTDDLDRFEDFVASWQGLIDNLMASPPKAQAKMAICRSNRCGKYVQEKDACSLLLARGGAGQISYLQANPWTKCVDNPPQFLSDLPIDSLGSGR